MATKELLTRPCLKLGLVQLLQYTDCPGDSEEKSLQFSWCVWTRYKNAIDDDDDDDDDLQLLIAYYGAHTMQNPLYLLTHWTLTTALWGKYYFLLQLTDRESWGSGKSHGSPKVSGLQTQDPGPRHSHSSTVPLPTLQPKQAQCLLQTRNSPLNPQLAWPTKQTFYIFLILRTFC